MQLASILSPCVFIHRKSVNDWMPAAVVSAFPEQIQVLNLETREMVIERECSRWITQSSNWMI